MELHQMVIRVEEMLLRILEMVEMEVPEMLMVAQVVPVSSSSHILHKTPSNIN